jgi:hypothetical protein
MYWFYKTAEDMNSKFQAGLPSFFMILIPILNILWLWKWCQAVEKVTKGGTSAVMALVFLLFLGPIGAMLIQNKFNELPATA